MKKLVLLILVLLSLCSHSMAIDLTPVYENTFDGDLEGWYQNDQGAEYTDAEIITEEDNNVLDISGATHGFGGGYPISLVTHTSSDCGNNYTLSLRAKIVKNYEYTGIVFRKNSSGSYNALVLDVYNQTFCISKNTIYTKTNYIQGTVKNYTDVDGFDPKQWNNYRFVMTDNNLKVYVNDTLVLNYTDTTDSLYDLPAVGGGLLTSNASETHIYIDDISFATSDSLLMGFYEIRGEVQKDLVNYPNGVKVLPDGFRVALDFEPTAAQIMIYDSETNEEIPINETKIIGNDVFFNTKVRMNDGKTYMMKIKKAVFADGDEIEGFSPVAFTVAPKIVSADAEFLEGKLNVTVKSSNRREVSSAIVMVAAYNGGYVSEIKAQKAAIPSAGYVDLAPFEFKNTPENVAIYIWNDTIGTIMYTEPIKVEVQK